MVTKAAKEEVWMRPLKPKSPESRIVEASIYYYAKLGYDPMEGEMLRNNMTAIHRDVAKRTYKPGKRAISAADVAEFLWKFGKLLNKQ